MQPQNLNSLSPLLARAGKNYALAKPILDLRDGQKKPQSKLHEAVKKLYLSKLKAEESTWSSWISWGQLISLYCKGEFFLQKNPRSPGYYVRPLANSENRQQSANLIRTYRHMCLSKIVSTNPNVRISAGDDDPRSIASAQNARQQIDYWESQFYKARYSQRSGLHKLNNGISITRVRWNPFAQGPMSPRFDVEEGEDLQLGAGYGECLDCPHQGEAEEFQNPDLEYGGQCPECGSHAVEVSEPAKSPMSRVKQGQPENMGAPDFSLIPLASARWDLAKDFELSSWGIIRYRVKLGDVKMLVGDAILPDTESSDDKSLEVLHNLAYAGNTFGNTGSQREYSRTHDRHPTVAEFWASPEDFADIEIEGGKTVEGDELPSGRMSDVFKKPVCFVGLNDMSLQIGIYCEHTGREQIVTGQWEVEADSGAGRGIQDATVTQKRYNRWDGHIDQGLAATATPAVLIDKRLLDDDQSGYVFKPGTTLKLNLTQMPPNFDMRKALHVGTPGQINNQAISYGQEHLMDMFQLQTFNLEFNGNIMNVDPKTFGGAQLASSLANSLFGPVGAVIGEERVRIAEILYELTKKHDPVGRYYPGKDGTRGKVISGNDLKGKLVFELVQDSVVPTTPFTKRQDLSAFVQGMGGIEGIIALKQGDPQMFREFAKIGNVKVESEDSDTVSSLCLGRLQQVEDKFAAGVTDPAELIASIQPPPSVIEPKHKEKREWWSSWTDLEEGLKSPLPIRQAAEQMYLLHLQLESQKNNPEAIATGWTAGLSQAAMAAPTAMGQAALQQNAQPGQPDPAQEQQHAAQQNDADRQAELLQQQNEHEHEAALRTMEIGAEDRRTATQLAVADAHKKMDIDSAEKTAKLNATAKAKAAKNPAAKGSK